MTDQYLIAHKVRGEPAFDVAINIGNECDGDLWIIPTSGHRAYPYWYRPLADLLFDDKVPDMPPIADHYAVNDMVRKPKPIASLEELA